MRPWCTRETGTPSRRRSWRCARYTPTRSDGWVDRSTRFGYSENAWLRDGRLGELVAAYEATYPTLTSLTSQPSSHKSSHSRLRGQWRPIQRRVRFREVGWWSRAGSNRRPGGIYRPLAFAEVRGDPRFPGPPKTGAFVKSVGVRCGPRRPALKSSRCSPGCSPGVRGAGYPHLSGRVLGRLVGLLANGGGSHQPLVPGIR